MSKLVRVLFATASVAVAIGANSAFAACISGGVLSNAADCIAANSGTGDCLLAWSVDFDGSGNPPLDDGAPTSNVVCADGDPCDRDGHINGRCTFHVGACVNAGCSSSLTTFELGKPSQKDVDKKSAKDPYLHYNRRTLATNIDAIVGGSQACTDENLELVVPLKSKGGLCNSPADTKCTNDQDCDDYCVFAYSKNKAVIKAEVADATGDNKDSDSLKFTCLPPSQSSPGQCSEVFHVTNASDLIGGPLAQGRVNDWMLRNSDIRVLVRDVGRQFSFMRTYGGAILDADLVRATPAEDRDSWMGMQPLVHIAATQNTQSISVLDDGSSCTPGILTTSGPDDLFDVLSPDVAIFSAGNTLTVPLDAAGTNLPLNLTTQYKIRPDRPYVEVATTFENTGGTELDLFVGDYVNGGGQLEDFGPGVGFGQPLLRKGGSGSQGAEQGLDYLAFQGVGDAAGVSYGVVFPAAPSGDPKQYGTYSTGAFTQSGVSAWLHNSDLVSVLNPPPPLKPPGPFVVPAGGENTLRRWFVVGKTINDVTKAREELFGHKLGIIQGTVTSNGQPVAGAHVAFLRDDVPGNRCGDGNCQNVFSGTITDEFGFYRGFLPSGDFNVTFRGEGVPYENSAGTPASHRLTTKGGKTITLDVDLPATGALHVTIEDQNGDPIAGKVSVVGFEKSPDPKNLDDIAGFIGSIGRYFGFDPQEKDGDTGGVVKAIFADHNGDAGTQPLEPGSYHIVVSHGPEYDVYDQAVTITGGATTNINAVVHQVVDTTGFVSVDTHVHMLESPDSAVTDVNRITSQMAEGVDFFTPTDHDHIHDLTGTIAAMGATGKIATAPSEEITTFNFGHYNVWPLTVNGSSITGGALDWGRAPAVPGQGFVGDLNYDLSPAEMFGSFNPATQVVQVNHFNSATLGQFNLLGVDTVVNPPASTDRVYRCSGGDRNGLPCQGNVCIGGTNDGNTCSTNGDCPGGDKCNTPPFGRNCPNGGTCVDAPDNLGSFIRQDPGISNLYDDNYTALEVWIEQDRGQSDLMRHDNLADWAGLLNQGDFKAGTADSDTHIRRTVPAGGPRTYVASSTDDPGSIDPSALAAAVNDGRAIGSGGLFMRVELVGDLGATASAALGDPRTVPATLGSGTVNVHVESPTWAQFDRIEIYANSNPACKSQFTFQGFLGKTCDVTPLATLNKGVDFTVNTTTGVSGSGQRLVADVSQPLTITADTWVIVIARGTDNVSKPLFPVNPPDLPVKQCLGGVKEGDACTADSNCGILSICANRTLADLTDNGVSPPWNLGEKGQLAMAFSNPLFFDKENDGFCNGGTACP